MISMPTKLKNDIDAVCDGNRSKWFRDLAIEKLKELKEESG